MEITNYSLYVWLLSAWQPVKLLHGYHGDGATSFSLRHVHPRVNQEHADGPGKTTHMLHYFEIIFLQARVSLLLNITQRPLEGMTVHVFIC